jgi:hypothetical protein
MPLAELVDLLGPYKKVHGKILMGGWGLRYLGGRKNFDPNFIGSGRR